SRSGRWAMKKRREQALHLFQLTGRERAVNRLHVDKVRQRIVQKKWSRRSGAAQRSSDLKPRRNGEARMTNDQGMTKREWSDSGAGVESRRERRDALPRVQDSPRRVSPVTIHREMSRCEGKRKPSPCKTDAAHSESSTCMARAARPLGRVRSG